MRKPKVSVIMPVFNGERYLKQSIKSILSQSFKDFEFIIIDDASTDGTVRIINSLKDKRIKLLSCKINQGVTKSLNFGLSRAKGKYIARMDADDISQKDRLKKQVNFLDTNPEYVLVGTSCQWINEKNERIPGFEVAIENRQIRHKMFIRNQFHHASVVFRSRSLKKIGDYKTIFNGAEDYELWFRLLKEGKGYNFPQKLIKRRIYQDAVSSKHHLKIESLALIVRLINIGGLWPKNKS